MDQLLPLAAKAVFALTLGAIFWWQYAARQRRRAMSLSRRPDKR